jgi:hypothetical protein
VSIMRAVAVSVLAALVPFVVAIAGMWLARFGWLWTERPTESIPLLSLFSAIRWATALLGVASVFASVAGPLIMFSSTWERTRP